MTTLPNGTGTATVPTAGAAPTPPAGRLNSSNAGVVVFRVGQLRAAFRSEGRRCVRDLSEYLNSRYGDDLTAVVFEETFGTKDRLHWVLHMRSLQTQSSLARLDDDDGWRELAERHRIPESRGGGTWEAMFVDGGLRETVLLPQSFGMYGTAQERPDTVVRAEGETLERFDVPTARSQTGQEDRDVLHTGNAGLVMHRTGELHYDLRAEGRQFARALAEGWNGSLAGHATILLYEEVFGLSDRVHWLIHLKSIETYYHLMGLRARTDPAAREVFTKSWVAEEKGGGGWERLFRQGSLADLALTPQGP